MNRVERMLKTLACSFAESPLETVAGIGRRLLGGRTASRQVLRLREITRESPLVLQVETTNMCNARCVFCAYRGMKREKGTMSMPLFERIVQEHAAMGGGPVSLTPVLGEALLDPHLLERLRILDACPQVCQVSLTTNGIALDRYTDEELGHMLELLDCVQVSIGGLEAATYATLYGVDRLPLVRRGLERLLALREKVAHPAGVTLAFRTNDWRFERRFKPELDGFRRRGVFVSHIWSYANYSGLIKNDDGLQLAVVDAAAKMPETCIYASVHMAICWDGRITACGCADYEGDALGLGRVAEDTLGDVWGGRKRQAILDSFARGKPPEICRRCSAYQPDSAIFSRKFCREIRPHRPLPPEYFQRFWGG